MRIALLNCYLQGGHTENAEIEAAARFAAAAHRLGIEAEVFARSEDLYDYRPDFVLALSYNDAKLTPYPTYVLLTMPVGWVANLPRFVRNVLSFDGYWTVAPSVSAFAGALFEKAGKPDLGAFAAISFARTEFVPLDFSRAWAAYIGTNWDGRRHGDIFRELARSPLVKFYGKRERWSHLPETAFGGEVPFDGVSVLDTYRAAGIGLCISHPDFDAGGIPTSRIFEVPAASAVMIAGRNRLIEEAFAGGALYVDGNAGPADVAEQIRGHVEWIRGHPKQAVDMAAFCHQVFNERFAMEALLVNALAMHRNAVARLGFDANAGEEARPIARNGGSDAALDATIVVSVRDQSYPFLERCLASVVAQTLPPSRIVILDATSGGKAGAAARARGASHPIACRRVPRGSGAGLGAALARAAKDLATEWVCCISAEEVLFPNHLFAIAEAVRRHRARRGGGVPGLVYSGLTQTSAAEELPEIMNDRYNVMRAEHMRLVQFDFQIAWNSITRLPMHPASCALHLPALRSAMGRPWMLRFIPALLARRLRAMAKGGGIAFTAAVTMATSGTRTCKAFGQFAPP